MYNSDKNKFHFSNQQRIGFIIFIIVLIGSVLFFRFYLKNSKDETEQLKYVEQSLEEQPIKTSSINQDAPLNSIEDPSEAANNQFDQLNNLKKFDPNTISESELIAFGLSPKVAKTIINYRNKGGKFKYKDDLSKMYTLKSENFDQLRPYINLPVKPEYNNSSNNEYKNNFDKDSKYVPKSIHNININNATIAELTTLPGIGNGYATKIINYRDQLGGFSDKAQIDEIYGLSDSLKPILKNILIINQKNIKKINLNSADEQSLKAHPYFKKHAKYIILYRNDIGNFENIEQVKNVPLLNEENFRKIAPYITLH